MNLPQTELVINRWAEKASGMVMKRLTDGRKIATGKLVNSIKYKVKREGDTYTVWITGKDYLQYVESGRRPGAKMPPVEPIEQWIKKKRIPIGAGRTKTLVKRGRQAPKAKQLRNMAFLIARSIGKRGIKPFPVSQILDSALKTESFRRELHLAVTKDVMENIRSGIKINVK